MPWQTVFLSPPNLQCVHPISAAEHCPSPAQVRVVRAGLLNPASEEFLDIFKTSGLPRCLIAQNYRDVLFWA